MDVYIGNAPNLLVQNVGKAFKKITLNYLSDLYRSVKIEVMVSFDYDRKEYPSSRHVFF